MTKLAALTDAVPVELALRVRAMRGSDWEQIKSRAVEVNREARDFASFLNVD